MGLKRAIRECIRWGKNDKLAKHSLKRKKWTFASIILICAAFDVLLLYIGDKAIFILLRDALYLPKKYAQTYTHLTTLRENSDHRHQDTINAIAFSPDGKTIATGITQQVHLWDINSGKLLSTFKGHSGPVNAVVFSPDGKTVASVSRDRKRSSIHPTILWDPSAEMQKIAHYQMAPYTIRLWDIRTAVSRLTFTEFISPLTALEFSPDSTKLLIASQNGVIDVYDSATGRRELHNLGLFVHDRILNRIGTIAFAASPGDKIITRWIWKTDDFMPSRISRTEAARRFSFVQWFTHFRFVGEPGIGLNTGPSGSLSFLIPNTYRISALAFSPSGKILASGSRSREIQLYDNTAGQIQLWDADTGHLLHTLNSPGGWVNLLTFSPDGKTLASTGKRWQNMISIWDVESLRLITIINVSDVGERGVRTLKFSPDSITLASGHVSGAVQIWDITGRTKSEQVKED
jgi:WD40 repeat protein